MMGLIGFMGLSGFYHKQEKRKCVIELNCRSHKRRATIFSLVFILCSLYMYVFIYFMFFNFIFWSCVFKHRNKMLNNVHKRKSYSIKKKKREQ